MAFTVRSIITEALARSNLVARRQPAPGNIVEDAYALLKGIAANYSRHNLLQFLRREVKFPMGLSHEVQYVLGNGYREGVDFWFVDTNGELPPVPSAGVWDRARCWDKDCQVSDIYTEPGQAGIGVWRTTTYPSKEVAMAHLNDAITAIIEPGFKPVLILGTVDPEIESDWVDGEVPNIADITELYWKPTSNPDYNSDIPLQFVSYEDFNDASYGINIYTWQHITDTKVELRLKPMFVNQIKSMPTELTLVYNLKYSFNLDSVLKIPDIYEELFITALTYKLAVQFPRLSPEHTERLRLTMENIENSLKTVTRANKLLIREGSYRNNLTTIAQLNSGSFIWGS